MSRKIINKIDDNTYEEREIPEMSLGTTIIYAGLGLYLLYVVSLLF